MGAARFALPAVLALFAALATAPRVSSSPSEARPGGDRAAWDSAQIDSLSRRITRLEGLLRIGRDTPEGHQAFRQRYAELRERERAAAAAAEEWLRGVPGGPPVAGGTVTSSFSPGRFHPIRLRVIPHVGLDIAAAAGTPVRATADGLVAAVADHPTYGRTVDVDHGATRFVTRYAHLSRIAVRPGERVRRGHVLGSVGRTGLATGFHLHYEVFLDGWRRDPVDYLPPMAVAPATLPGAD